MKKIIILLYALFLCSCEDFLDVPPESQVSPDNFYQNENQAVAAVNAIYQVLTNMYKGGHNFVVLGDIAANGFIGDVPYDEHTVDPADGILSSLWTNSFDGINRANAAIDNIPRADASDAAKNTLIGEAKYLRALFYFNLVRIFGGVPLNDHELTSLEEAIKEKASEAEIYDLIVSDLTASSEVLPLVAEDVGRATQGAAKALLADVYLTLQDFEKARGEAKAVIDFGIYELWSQYEEAFRVANENGKESIFEVQYQSDLGGLGNNKNFILPDALTDLVMNGPVFRNYFVEDVLLNTYEDGDLRKNLDAVTSMEVNGETVVLGDFPVSIKYIDESFTVNIQDANNNWPLRRYADVLLMFAEAENEVNGPTAEALEAVNQVRRRVFGEDLYTASVHDIAMGISQDDFRNAIWAERFKEFALEGKHWYDLKRTGRLMAIEGIPATKLVYPIPQRELDSNPKMVQNEGY
jgi:hypothetical protein